jgi:hypothetical protein
VTLKRAAYDVERPVGDLKQLRFDGAIVDQLSAILRAVRCIVTTRLVA